MLTVLLLAWVGLCLLPVGLLAVALWMEGARQVDEQKDSYFGLPLIDSDELVADGSYEHPYLTGPLVDPDGYLVLAPAVRQQLDRIEAKLDDLLGRPHEGKPDWFLENGNVSSPLA